LSKRRAIIIGAGPAGLTAAWELLDRSELVPLVLEASEQVGGLSRTVEHAGNRIDIGGHRFFSRSARVMDWWTNILPLQGAPARDDRLLGREVPLASHCRQRTPGAGAALRRPAPDPELSDDVMLVRQRLSRIFFEGAFFDYPLSPGWPTIARLGPGRSLRMGLSYARARLRPRRPERSLEDFFVNRFGRELYRLFFEDYTEKVWGLPPRALPPDWGSQRVRGLSAGRALADGLLRSLPGGLGMDRSARETSLIGEFLYPKLGPGQLWEEVARQVQQAGGQLRLNCRVTGFELAEDRVVAVRVEDPRTGSSERLEADLVLSSMPLKSAVAGLGAAVPVEVRDAAAGLAYRDFITVGVLARRLLLRDRSDRPSLNGLVPDNWIYIQDRSVRLGRLQIFNNWSPYLVRDPALVWLGLEYFCARGDSLWERSDQQLMALGAAELERLAVADPRDLLDQVVIRMPGSYPAYHGSYARLPLVRRYLDGIANLVMLGRNGQHRYNNMDHSMLTAMVTVDGLCAGRLDRDGIWGVNAEGSYAEERGSR